MARKTPKIVLAGSRDIAFAQLVLSQANVRRTKSGVSVPELAEDIARRGLLKSLNVRPLLGEDGAETGQFEVPAGGRRFQALELLVKQKRLAPDTPVPCIVKAADDPISAEEDSYAENHFHEPLHPLDEFRAMQTMVEQGHEPEAIAARFRTTPAVVRQRLKLSGVSSDLHAVYAEDGMTLDQLMAFAVSDDHERQKEVWALVQDSFNKSPSFIRQKLTEAAVRVGDRRVQLIGVEAYVEAGGTIMRDLFEADQGGWLSDPVLLDRLVGDRLKAEADRLTEAGWKWVSTAIMQPYGASYGLRELEGEPIPMSPEEEERLGALRAEAKAIEEEWSDRPDCPDDIARRFDAIDDEIGLIEVRPLRYDPEEMARAGVFISIDPIGELNIECGFVRPEDEPVDPETATPADEDDRGDASTEPDEEGEAATAAGDPAPDEPEESGLKPLPDGLVAELTAWRTLALQDVVANSPGLAFLTVLHAMALDAFYLASRESCLELSLHKVGFSTQPAGLRECGPAKSIAERHIAWKETLPNDDADLWTALCAFDHRDALNLLAHCASLGINAQQEVVPKYDNGRISAHTVARRVAHSHVLARAAGLDIVGAGWTPTVDNYFDRVPKARILADVAEAKGEEAAGRIDHLKKTDMKREAETLMADAGWIPEPMRTPSDPNAANGPDTPASAAVIGSRLEDLRVASNDPLGQDEPEPIAAE